MPTPHNVLAIIEKARAEKATFVDLGNCGLTELPDELFELTGLQKLNLGSRYWKKGQPKETENSGKQNKLSAVALNQLIRFSDSLLGLYLSELAISNISVLAKLTQLQILDLKNTKITDISVLAGLTQLQTLSLSETAITDIGVLAGLTQLQKLYLWNTAITDISVLAGLSQLQELNVGNTKITDISVLAGLTQLQTLELWNTAITDTSILAGLTQLQTLGLGKTAITDIGVLIGLSQLQELYLGNTKITDISVLAGLSQLQTLELWNTAITDISMLAGLTQLQTLGLGKTAITDIGVLIGLSQLQELYLGDTKITDISVLAGLSQLQTLELWNTAITDISILARLTQLQTLGLGKTAITDIGVLARLTQLQKLDLRDTKITDISVLAGLSQLQTLELWNTAITDISMLARLTQLQTLGLGKTAITDIGVLIGLSQLQELYLGNTKITDISVLAGLSQLQTLSLSETAITDIGVLAGLTQLQTLSLSETAITDISILARLTQLQTLGLGETAITDIGVLIGLSQLQELYLGNTKITDISVLAGLTQLQTLSLSETAITDIGVLAGLTQLQKLYLWNTAITDISVLAGLSQLQELNVGNTKITDISVLAGLTQLQKLYLWGTKITDISVLAGLSQLQELNLWETKIQNKEMIAEVLLSNHFLTDLSLDKGIPGIPEGLETDAVRLRDFFRKQQATEASIEPNRSLKLILLGNTRAGKSQLLNRFMKRKFETDSPSTDGLKVDVWSPEIQQDQYRITCFDFGGQDFYHATHNLYLDNRALYLVLWHPQVVAQSQHLPPGYWLGNIAYFTEADTAHNMAIWTMQSRADEAARTGIDSEQMKLYGADPDGQFYLSIQEAETFNSRWESEWAYFRQRLDRKIQALAQNVPPSNYEIIAVRDEVIPRLRAQKRMVVSSVDFDMACRLNATLQLFAPSDYSSTLKVLQAAGELLWYGDISAVAAYIIVDPSRWAEFIFTVLGRDSMAKNDGEFDRKSLATAIKNSKVHAEEKTILPKLFVALLQEYQLIFEKPGVAGRYVVPQYLPEQPLAQYLQKLIPLTLVVLYEHYMPFWRITQFITQKATTAGSQPHYWKYGIIYEETGCTVMVRIQRPLVVSGEPDTEAKLYVHVEGPAEQRIQILTEVVKFFGQVQQFKKAAPTSKRSLTGKGNRQLAIDSDKQELTALADASKPTFIKRIQFSVNDREFFAIDNLHEALVKKEKYLKTTAGGVLPIPALFYPLLDYRNTMPKRIFFSYAHADAQYRRELDVHFAALKRGQYVETWHDMEISPGEKWDQRIKDEIDRADLVLALISPDFMNSSYIWEQEIPRMQEKFVPIFLRPCDFDETIIAPVQGLPKHYEAGDNAVAKGIRWIVSSKWQYRDEAYLAVIDGLKAILKK